MKRQSPAVREYMTHLPVELERCESAGEAEALMKQLGIHHLPVMNGSHLVGVITEKSLIKARLYCQDTFESRPLEDLSSADWFAVCPVDPVAEVAAQILERETDHAIVMDGGFVVGIITITDVLRFVKEHFGV
jgi:CBS domain-containing protein